MNILVTGATGFIGRYLVDRLLEEKHTVFALVRKTSNVARLKEQGVKLFYGDVADEKTLQGLEKYQIQALFHTAACVTENNWKKLFSTNVIGTENICRLSLALKLQRLVYVSSVAVVSGHGDVPLREDAPYRATNLYGASKLDAEKKVIEFREKHGLKVSIIRPPMVYGEGEPHALNKILTLLKFRLLPIVGDGAALWHLVYVKNVAEALLLTLYKEEALSGTFFVGDNEILTVKEIFNLFALAINAPLPYTLPSNFTPFLLKTPYIGKRMEFFLKDRIYDLSRIKLLGFSPKFKAKESLIVAAKAWLKK